jgi:hypothetical protein
MGAYKQDLKDITNRLPKRWVGLERLRQANHCSVGRTGSNLNCLFIRHSESDNLRSRIDHSNADGFVFKIAKYDIVKRCRQPAIIRRDRKTTHR